jgi:hypothetical protein
MKRGRASQIRPRILGPRQYRYHLGHLQPRAARHGGPSGKCHGKRLGPAGNCQVTAKENRMKSRSSSLRYVCPAKLRFSRVEPRGVEPLTSAVQRRRDALLALSRHCKTAAKPLVMTPKVFLTLQDVYPGCCTVAAHEAHPAGLGPCDLPIRNPKVSVTRSDPISNCKDVGLRRGCGSTFTPPLRYDHRRPTSIYRSNNYEDRCSGSLLK